MPDEKDGSDILGPFLRGEPEVLAEILRQCGPRARWVLRRGFGGRLDAEDIEDVLAVALFKLWKSRPRYDPARISLAGWFEVIARNTARDVVQAGWQRARQREHSCDESLLCALGADDLDGMVEAEVDAESLPLLQRRLHDLMRQLPEAQRRILEADIACWPEVAPSAELASKLGLAASSVPAYRRRAREWLRERLREEGLSLESDSGMRILPPEGSHDAAL